MFNYNRNRARHESNIKNQSKVLVNHLGQTITDRFGPLNDGNIGV